MSRTSRGLFSGTKSHSPRLVTLTIQGTNDSLTFPVEVTTKVIEVKYSFCQKLGIEPNQMQFVLKTTSSYKLMLDSDEMAPKVIVKGIRQWTREVARYPYPHGIIGAGHGGLRQALSFFKEGIEDYVIYDRWDKVGGTAWVKNANPTSKLQTELGVYHLQYDSAWECPRATMRTWPTRADLLMHFEEVSRDFGIWSHCQLSTEVTECKLVIAVADLPFHRPDKQYYEVVSTRLDSKTGDEVEITFSTVSFYPGALTCPLRLEFKGEDVFDGQIGYGMFNEFDYKEVPGKVPAVVGFGAFAVENIRTCLEHGAESVWLVCRRKNIAMPRVISWFINQSLYPPPGAMCMDAMQPMYDLIPDDPWEYYGVMANKDRTSATIRQKSRFGIGDVYFIAAYYKKVQTVVDQIKRLKPNQILLESGEKLEAHAIIKVLGFKPDHSVDKIMGVKEMNAEFMSWFIRYPKDLGPLFDSQMLPKHKADKEKNLPAYVWDPRQGSSVGMLLSGGVIPGLAEAAGGYGTLNRQKQLEAHPLEQFVDECAGEWKNYCELFKASGDDRPFPPYPYTHEFVRELCKRNDEEGEADAIKQAQRMGG